jgi:NTE family protein
MNDIAHDETGAKTASAPKAGRQATRAPAVKTVNLALQGGGAHGAFTWGVLDRLLEEEGLSFEGISATSAGAMNASVLAYGLTVGGREGARKALTNYWRRISHAAMSSPLQPSPIDRMLHDHSLRWSPAFVFFDIMTRLMSPYEFNPMNLNPLRDVVQQSVDFTVLNRDDCPVKLFLSATNVRTGKVKIFERGELSVDAALASACLPFMFQAVEIDGEAYWDGGYMGNPALYPLIYDCDSKDILIVHINPLVRNELPKTAADILNRINEISFNSSLMREMRAISFVTRLIDQHLLDAKHVLIHGISDDSLMTGLGVASKLNADWEFVTHLRDVGRVRGDEWLSQHFAKVGETSTVDIHAKFL